MSLVVAVVVVVVVAVHHKSTGSHSLAVSRYSSSKLRSLVPLVGTGYQKLPGSLCQGHD